MFYLDKAKSRLLELVGSSRDSSNQAVSILRAPDGALEIVLSASLVPPNYEISSQRAPDPINDAIKETLSNIHQHSILRFAAVPIFVAAFGALAKFCFAPEDSPAEWVQLLTKWLGLAVALWFGIIEIFLSRNLIRWWKGIVAAVTKLADTPWSLVFEHRDSDNSLTFVRFMLLLPYSIATGFWSTSLLDSYHRQLTGRRILDGSLVAMALLVAGGAVWQCAKRKEVKFPK